MKNESIINDSVSSGDDVERYSLAQEQRSALVLFQFML